MTTKAAVALILTLIAVAIAAPTAQADRHLLTKTAVETRFCKNCLPSPSPRPEEILVPPTEGQIEGPCGTAVAPNGSIYVADYYHRAIDLYSPPQQPTNSAAYQGTIFEPGSNPIFGINALDSVCGMAFDADGTLYTNEFHQGVRVGVDGALIDDGESTGIAIDPSTKRLYVDDRTYIAEYALPAAPGDGPRRRLGSGKVGDGFGLAAYGGTLYIADAADQTIKVFRPGEPGGTQPAAVVDRGFVSLVDSSLAVDPTNEHLLVVDNLQPGFAHPQAAVYELSSFATGNVLLGRLAGSPTFGAPSGIAVDGRCALHVPPLTETTEPKCAQFDLSNGNVYVTDGNDEESNVYAYGPYGSTPLAAASPNETAGVQREAPVTPQTSVSPSAPLAATVASGSVRRSHPRRSHRRHQHQFHHRNRRPGSPR
jgi:DNA-binding beta-propeller fold protein YncE